MILGSVIDPPSPALSTSIEGRCGRVELSTSIEGRCGRVEYNIIIY